MHLAIELGVNVDEHNVTDESTFQICYSHLKFSNKCVKPWLSWGCVLGSHSPPTLGYSLSLSFQQSPASPKFPSLFLWPLLSHACIHTYLNLESPWKREHADRSVWVRVPQETWNISPLEPSDLSTWNQNRSFLLYSEPTGGWTGGLFSFPSLALHGYDCADDLHETEREMIRTFNSLVSYVSIWHNSELSY